MFYWCDIDSLYIEITVNQKYFFGPRNIKQRTLHESVGLFITSQLVSKLPVPPHYAYGNSYWKNLVSCQLHFLKQVDIWLNCLSMYQQHVKKSFSSKTANKTFCICFISQFHGLNLAVFAKKYTGNVNWSLHTLRFENIQSTNTSFIIGSGCCTQQQWNEKGYQSRHNIHRSSFP